jgi:hypothetical protein
VRRCPVGIEDRRQKRCENRDRRCPFGRISVHVLPYCFCSTGLCSDSMRDCNSEGASSQANSQRQHEEADRYPLPATHGAKRKSFFFCLVQSTPQQAAGLFNRHLYFVTHRVNAFDGSGSQCTAPRIWAGSFWRGTCFSFLDDPAQSSVASFFGGDRPIFDGDHPQVRLPGFAGFAKLGTTDVAPIFHSSHTRIAS